MPLFEYMCQNCETTFELLVRDGSSPACPDCHGTHLDKLFSVPAAHTNGNSPSAGDLPISSGGPCGMGGCGLPECGG